TDLGEIKTVFTSSKNSTVLVGYVFKLNGKEITGVSSTGCSDSKYYSFLKENLTAKSLTVAFQKDNPNNCEMLFSSRDYEEFKLHVPGSQKFIVKIIDSLLNNK
ncbi:MAG: hypothetical protein ABL872_19420, partial [Lacibacter sp.]